MTTAPCPHHNDADVLVVVAAVDCLSGAPAVGAVAASQMKCSCVMTPHHQVTVKV